MAAVAPPPNVHLTALANHFTQAAAEATALAANPPAHLNPLAHIAGQLQLILNSINALDQRMNDLDHKLHINFQLL
jgi:hypothetical protein